MYPILGIDGKLVENADELMETFPNALRESDATQAERPKERLSSWSSLVEPPSTSLFNCKPFIVRALVSYQTPDDCQESVVVTVL